MNFILFSLRLFVANINSRSIASALNLGAGVLADFLDDILNILGVIFMINTLKYLVGFLPRLLNDDKILKEDPVLKSCEFRLKRLDNFVLKRL